MGRLLFIRGTDEISLSDTIWPEGVMHNMPGAGNGPGPSVPYPVAGHLRQGICMITGCEGGLPVETGRDPVVLILGSYPGPRSLAAGEYYANPQNQFWRIMEALFRIDRMLPYPERVARLNGHRVALWDVIRSCRREGALDSAIRDVVQNNIRQFLELHPHIRFIGANGNTAGRYLVSGLQDGPAIGRIPVGILPSTSPANTRYTFEEKLKRWEIIREYLP